MTWYVTPTTVRILNFLGNGVDAVGLGPRLTPAALEARARRKAGLSDLGDGAHSQPLALLCRSFTEDAHLSFFGRIIAQELLTSALVTRLRLQKLRADADPRLETPLNRPIIVLGLPRSGTTLLHRFLAEQPGLRPLRTWELSELLPPPSTPPARIKRDARAKIGVIRQLAPELDIKHLFGADEPEEEVSLLDASFWTPTFWRFGMITRYQDWYLRQDPRPGYAVYTQMLRVLQSQDPSRRFILKMPNHTGYVDTIKELMPEAVLIHPHRDPRPVVASYASLMRSVHRIAAVRWDPAEGGRQTLRLWAHHARRNLQARDHLDDGDILDVRFTDLLSDLSGAMRRILAHADLPIPTDLDAQAARHQDRRGPKHLYALGDYGLTGEQVDAEFAAYRDAFLC